MKRKKPKGRDIFVKTRKERAERLARDFEKVINNVLKDLNSVLEFKYRGISGEPDYEVLDREKGEIICYFEAEFPDIDRWPPGSEFKYPTIRWPSRKWVHYRSLNGLFRGKPLFLITIRDDLQDAYYIDCRTWFKKAKEERLSNGTCYYGLKKDDEDLGRGLKNIPSYIMKKIKENYES